jgi:hypothetical protein
MTRRLLLCVLCCVLTGAGEPKLPVMKKRAEELAAAFLKQEKTDWGDPEKIEERGAFYLYYKTPEIENGFSGPRVVVVSYGGKVRFQGRAWASARRTLRLTAFSVDHFAVQFDPQLMQLRFGDPS